jgi:hypothetical protein
MYTLSEWALINNNNNNIKQLNINWIIEVNPEKVLNELAKRKRKTDRVL